jgi:hypothetical protein
MVKCCKCHRVRVNGEWERIDQGDSEDQMYSHSYCPACLAEVHAELEVCDLFTSA